MGARYQIFFKCEDSQYLLLYRAATWMTTIEVNTKEIHSNNCW